MTWKRKIRRIKGEEREVIVKRVGKGAHAHETIRMVHPRRGTKPQSRYKIVSDGKERWFQARDDLSGWEKTQSDVTRMNHLQEEINERMRERKMNRREAKLSVARALQALANVTQDRETKQKARRDARILFTQLKTPRTKNFQINGKSREFQIVETNIKSKDLDRRKKHWRDNGNYVRTTKRPEGKKVRYDIFAVSK